MFFTALFTVISRGWNRFVIFMGTNGSNPSEDLKVEINIKVYFRHTSVSLVEQLRAFITRYNYDWETKPV